MMMTCRGIGSSVHVLSARCEALSLFERAMQPRSTYHSLAQTAQLSIFRVVDRVQHVVVAAGTSCV